MLPLRRSAIGRVTLAIVFLSVALVGSPANAARDGAKCKTAGSIEITKGVAYRCLKSGTTLKWKKTKAKFGPNKISFSPSVSLLLSTQTYPLSGTSTFGLPLTYKSLTPDTCSVSGETLTLIRPGSCTVQALQNGSRFYKPAQPVQVSVEISDARVASDQIDSVTGFQVKPIYVVPADGVDHSYDTNGYISGILDEGNGYLRQQLNLQIPIDKHSMGYDIQYLKSNLTSASLQSANIPINQLLAESLVLENPGPNRKNYIFFIDVNDLSNGTACGWAYIPYISSVVAVGKEVDATGIRCTGQSNNFADHASWTWVHELIHNFGVDHTLNAPCDLMRGAETPGTCPSNENITVDKERTRYIGSSSQGQDILQLRVWEGYTDRPDLVANCWLLYESIPRADGVKFAYCPTGTQTIGALTHCWSVINSVTLQEFVDGQWRSLGPASYSANPWSPVDWSCNTPGYTAPSKQLTVTTSGISLYRWMVNGKQAEQFKVIWVR